MNGSPLRFLLLLSALWCFTLPAATAGEAPRMDPPPIPTLPAPPALFPETMSDLEIYRQAANAGHAAAQYRLGLLLARGQGVTRDHVKSFMWLELALQGGVEEAATARAEVATHLSPTQLLEAVRQARAWRPSAPTPLPDTDLSDPARECAARGGTWDHSRGRPQGHCHPDNAARCQERGGTWTRICMAQALACVMTFPDAGKPCTDSSQCQGECVSGINRATLQAKGEVVGQCKGNDDPCGCYAIIRNGKVASALCRD